MIVLKCEGEPCISIPFIIPFPLPHPSFPSSGFPYRPPAYSVHHSSPCIHHCFILTSLSAPLQHIIPSHQLSVQPAQSLPLVHFFIPLYLALYISLFPDSPRRHTSPHMPPCYMFFPICQFSSLQSKRSPLHLSTSTSHSNGLSVHPVLYFDGVTLTPFVSPLLTTTNSSSYTFYI